MRCGSALMVTVVPLSSVTVTGNVPSAGAASVEAVVGTTVVVAAAAVVATAATVEVLDSAGAALSPQPANTSEPAASRASSTRTSGIGLQEWRRRREGGRSGPAGVRRGVGCPVMRTPFGSTYGSLARKMVESRLATPRPDHDLVEPSRRPATSGRSRSLRGKRLLLLYSRYLTPGCSRPSAIPGYSGGTVPASYRLPSRL